MTLAQKMLQQNGVPLKKPEADNQSGGGDGNDNNHDDTNIIDDKDKNKGPDDQTKLPGATPAAETPISVEDIVKGLKAQGIEVSDFADIKNRFTPAAATPTADEVAAAAQKRNNEIRSFALQAGKVSTTVLDSYARESQLPFVDLAYSIFKAGKLEEAKAANTPEDQMPIDKDIRAEFDEANFLYAEETDPKRKLAEKRLQKETDEYLQSTYPAIYDMEEEYETHQTGTQLRSTYTSTIKDVVTALGTEEIKFPVTDDKGNVQEFPVKFSAQEIAAIQAIYEGDDMFNVVGRTKVPKENLAISAKNTLIQKNLTRVISDVAIAYASKLVDGIKMGRRNIPYSTASGANNNDGVDKKIKTGVKKMLKAAGVQQ